jgi:hypothetical protein
VRNTPRRTIFSLPACRALRIAFRRKPHSIGLNRRYSDVGLPSWPRQQKRDRIQSLSTYRYIVDYNCTLAHIDDYNDAALPALELELELLVPWVTSWIQRRESIVLVILSLKNATLRSHVKLASYEHSSMTMLMLIVMVELLTTGQDETVGIFSF